MLQLEAFSQRVKRARPDVAIDDADCEYRQLGEAPAVRTVFGRAIDLSVSSFQPAEPITSTGTNSAMFSITVPDADNISLSLRHMACLYSPCRKARPIHSRKLHWEG